MTRAAPAKLLGLKDRGHLGAGRARRRCDLPERQGHRQDVRARPHLSSRTAISSSRTARSRITAGARRCGSIRRRTRRWCGGWRNTTSSATACRSTGSLSPIPRFAREQPFGRFHAATERQRRCDRRHLRGSLRHARDSDRHHRAEPEMGAAGGDLDDGLRHVGHRLRLRGGDRCRTAAIRNARRAARLPRDDLRDEHGRTSEATAEPRRAMRPDLARQRLFRRPCTARRAEARFGAALFRRRLANLQKARRHGISGVFRSWTASFSARPRPE